MYGGKGLDPNSFKEKNARAFRGLIDICLDDFGLNPEFAITSPSYSGAEVPYFESTRFSNGDVLFNCFIERYIPFIRSITVARALSETDYRPLNVKLEKKAHVYNVRTKEYLGYKDRVAVSTAPGIANVFALSPKKVEGLFLALESIDARGVVIKTTLKGLEGTGFEPVIHIELYNPKGDLVKHYSQNIVLNSKTLSASTTIHYALNDPPGTWEVKAVDVLSGIQTTQTYELK